MVKSIKGWLVAIAVVVSLGLIPAAADASPFTVTYTMTLACDTCAAGDALGLDGATVVFTAGFDTTDTYLSLFGFPFIVANSESLTISGASVATTNGSYTEVDGVGIGFLPTFAGQMEDANGFLADYDVNGTLLTLFRLAVAVGGVSVGDTISLSDFGTVIYTNSTNFFAGDDGYDIETLQFSTATVPEPATLLLVGSGLVGAYLRRRFRA